jgi:hypothetical protein
MIRKSESRVLTEIRSTRVAAPDATTASPHLRGKVKVTVSFYYLEPRQTKRLPDHGPDRPATVISLCPNCHRRAHSADDKVGFNQSLISRLKYIEFKEM